MTQLIALLLWTFLFLHNFPKKIYGQENNFDITEIENHIVDNGDNLLIACSFPVYREQNSNNIFDIKWLLPTSSTDIKINGSHITEEKIYLNDSIHSILTISSSSPIIDEGDYICYFYKDEILLTQKEIHIDFSNVEGNLKNVISNDTSSLPPPQPSPANTVTIAIIISIVIILIIILVLIVFFICKRKKKENLTINEMNVRYNRNDSVNSNLELTLNEIKTTPY